MPARHDTLSDMKDTLPALTLPDWISLNEAAARLAITRQAVGQAALRLNWGRARLGNMTFVSRSAVEQYARTRQLSGPRVQAPR